MQKRQGDDQALEDALAGQGDLTISPLQAARAFAGLLAPGGMPGLRIVDAVRQEDATWHRLASLEEGTLPLNAEQQELARRWMQSRTGGILSYRAQAIRGAGGQTLAWFLGIIPSEQGSAVIAVALENGSPVQAENIGVLLLEAYQAVLP